MCRAIKQQHQEHQLKTTKLKQQRQQILQIGTKERKNSIYQRVTYNERYIKTKSSGQGQLQLQNGTKMVLSVKRPSKQTNCTCIWWDRLGVVD